jgi:hypothetical protein
MTSHWIGGVFKLDLHKEHDPANPREFLKRGNAQLGILSANCEKEVTIQLFSINVISSFG